MRVQHIWKLALSWMILIAPALCATAESEGTSESPSTFERATASAEADNELRIARPSYTLSSHFSELPPGYSIRWFRNLRQPSFCKMVLCHGTCAKPMRASFSPSNLGMPSPSASVPESITNSETPCGLKTFSGIVGSQSESACPMSQ